MSRRISEKTKLAEHRGTGEGADYIPWIKVAEFNSVGTCANPVDWKNGRVMHLLSQAELWWYYELRWDDNVTDIREQYPLDLSNTTEIAELLGVRHPGNGRIHMTTDFLVTYKRNGLRAYSVKSRRSDLDGERVLEKLCIEKQYWEQRKVPWKLLFKEDLQKQRITNIRTVVEYYDAKNVHDPISRIKHLIAVKQISVDMDKEIDYQALLRLQS